MPTPGGRRGELWRFHEVWCSQQAGCAGGGLAGPQALTLPPRGQEAPRLQVDESPDQYPQKKGPWFCRPRLLQRPQCSWRHQRRRLQPLKPRRPRRYRSRRRNGPCRCAPVQRDTRWWRWHKTAWGLGAGTSPRVGASARIGGPPAPQTGRGRAMAAARRGLDASCPPSR